MADSFEAAKNTVAMFGIAQNRDLYIGKMMPSERRLLWKIIRDEMLFVLTADWADAAARRREVENIAADIVLMEQCHDPR
jgi:hypothetical protein